MTNFFSHLRSAVGALGLLTGLWAGPASATALPPVAAGAPASPAHRPAHIQNTTGNALAFDGVDDYVSLPPTLLNGVTDFTFEAWFYFQDNGPWTRVMDFGAGTGTYMFLTPRNSVTNTPRFAMTATGVVNEELLTSATALATGWHHIAVTLSKSGAVVTGKLYVDGAVGASNAAMTLTPSDLGTLTQLWLGRSQYAVDPYLKGIVDEVRIYNTALTPAQVQADMASTSSALPGSQLAYYDFDQGVPGANNASVTALLDRSGNGRDGLLNTFALTGYVSNWVGAAPAPMITAKQPAANGAAASRTTPVSVTFNQPVAASAGAVLRVFSNQRGGERTLTVPATVSGNTLTFQPSAYDFRPGETVQAVVTSVVGTTPTVPTVPYTFQFTTAATGGSGNFGAGANLSGLGIGPRVIRAADFNNDGKLDLAYVTAIGNTLEVQLNTGTGLATGTTYSRSTNIAAGTVPIAMEVGDVNNDGKLDVVLLNNAASTTNNLRAFLGNGDGTFTVGPVSSFGQGSNQGLTMADFNGDGKLDVAVSENYLPSSQVYVLLGTGTGAFAGSTTATGGSVCFALIAGDFNNDGAQDILAPAYYGATASDVNAGTTAVLNLGTGYGGFTTAPTVTIGAAAFGLATADFNNDGNLDVVAACYDQNKIQVLLGNGDGTFAAPLTVAALDSHSVAVGDVNGDGKLDILATRYGNSAVAVLLNNGLGTGFTRTVQDVATGSGPLSVVVADLNNDGSLDLAVARYTNAGAVAVRLNEAYDLTVYNTHTVPGGTYGSLTVLGSNTTSGATTTGVATLGGPITVVGAATVQAGGTLTTACQPLSGGAGSSFTLMAGATLGICDPAGITATGSTGAVRTATRNFGSDANFIYNGTVAQVTGSGLPTTVRSLSVSNSTGLSLSQAVQVRQLVALTSGNLTLNSQALTLLSDASGTALIANTAGQVLGSTGTMQRHIETNTAASGYRHYASPVTGETVNTLATAGYAPNFGGAAAYNSSATPNQVAPFPTVYTYNQDRIATATSNYDAFSKGWQASLSGEAMPAGTGFSVQAPGAALVDFTGTFSTGAVTRTALNHTGADGGWQLLGNPYPSPLNWSTMTLGTGASLENMDGAMYVFQSSGPYTGTYRTYLASAPTGNSPLIPAGSGFFVRTTTPGVAGTVRFANANRVTTFGAQPAFGRSNDTRPVLTLTLTTSAGAADAATLYADATTTPGLDAAYDATKLSNPSGLDLATVAPGGEALTIDGRPVLDGTTLVPLRLNVPAAGSYTFAAVASNLPAGLVPYLRDLTTGTQTALTAATTLHLTAGLHTRYALAFAPATALATAAALTAAQVLLFPNPTTAKAGVTVALPVAAGTAEVPATVLNALGQTVATTILVVRGGEASGTIATTGLVAGVYTVCLRTGAATLSKRLVVE